LPKRRPICSSPVDVNETVREVLAFLRPEVVHNEIHVTLELGESLPAVLSDVIQLQQVLLNLMRNAVEAMETTDPPEGSSRSRPASRHPAWLR